MDGLASFVVLIVFQAMISREWRLITKCSAYICTFFELQRKDTHWKTFHRYEKYKALNKGLDKELCWRIYRWSTSFLAFFSLVALVSLAVDKYQQTHHISLSALLFLLTGLLLFHIVVYKNMKVFSKSNEDSSGLRDCTEEYLAYIKSKEKFNL